MRQPGAPDIPGNATNPGTLQMDDRGKVLFTFDRIEADILGFKVPLPKFNSDAGFVEVQVSQA